MQGNELHYCLVGRGFTEDGSYDQSMNRKERRKYEKIKKKMLSNKSASKEVMKILGWE